MKTRREALGIVVGAAAAGTLPAILPASVISVDYGVNDRTGVATVRYTYDGRLVLETVMYEGETFRLVSGPAW